MFLTIETSPGNFQAWLALPGMEDKDFARRLRKGTGADTTASGATLVTGSVNFKDKYAPHFPRVAIHTTQPGRARSAWPAWSQRQKLSHTRCALPPPVFPPAATADGRGMSVVWTVRR